jgi:predicted enzyme related to lactoylglutathione lyase
MSERDRYIPGVPCWVDTSQRDPAAAVAFYSGLFGWACEDAMPAGSESPYFIARLGDGEVGAIAGIAPGAPAIATWNTYVWVENAEETAERVWTAGGTCLADPFDVNDAGRMAVFADPEGATFNVWQPGRHRGAQVVNEPGSVNFNTLNTRDPDRAREFYNSVFGWETLPLGGSGEMWTLPGYGDHLALDRPAIREEMAAVGAPAGFEDVVASLNPIPESQSGTPAHWGVVFAVDDADATAAKAVELGGTVLVAPFDAPWVRTTVISDPQGATLTASRFVPENRDLPSAQSAPVQAA